MGATSEPSLLFQLLPYTLMLFVCSLFALPICRRKGRRIGWAFVCFFPLRGPLVLFWLASLTDRQVLDRLSQLEAKAAARVSGV